MVSSNCFIWYLYVLPCLQTMLIGLSSVPIYGGTNSNFSVVWAHPDFTIVDVIRAPNLESTISLRAWVWPTCHPKLQSIFFIMVGVWVPLSLARGQSFSRMPLSYFLQAVSCHMTHNPILVTHWVSRPGASGIPSLAHAPSILWAPGSQQEVMPAEVEITFGSFSWDISLSTATKASTRCKASSIIWG